MYSAEIRGTSAERSNSAVSVNHARGNLMDRLAAALYPELLLLLAEVLKRPVVSEEISVDTCDLFRPSPTPKPPVRVWVRVEQGNGALGTAQSHDIRRLVEMLDQYINDYWLPGPAKDLAKDAQVTHVEVVVFFHDTASVTYDELTGDRILLG